MAHWAEYFEQLLTVDPPSGQLQTAGIQSMAADTPIDETIPCIDEAKEACAQVNGWKSSVGSACMERTAATIMLEYCSTYQAKCLPISC